MSDSCRAGACATPQLVGTEASRLVASDGPTIALRAFLFWTRGESKFSTAIAVLTDGPWSHMGLGFELSDGTLIYYEALVGRKYGAAKSLEKLYAWANAHPDRQMVIVWLELASDVAEQKRLVCESWVGQKSYAEFQLFFMALHERWYLPVPPSLNRVVCSEAPTRILWPEIELCDKRRDWPDKVSPNSAWRRTLEIRAGHGDITAPMRRGMGRSK